MAADRQTAPAQCLPIAVRRPPAPSKIQPEQTPARAPPHRALEVATTSRSTPQSRTRQTSYNWQSPPRAHWTARPLRTKRQSVRPPGRKSGVQAGSDSPAARRFEGPEKTAVEKTRSLAIPRNRCACRQSAARTDSRRSTPQKIKRLSLKGRAAPAQTRSTLRKFAPARCKQSEPNSTAGRNPVRLRVSTRREDRKQTAVHRTRNLPIPSTAGRRFLLSTARQRPARRLRDT